MHANKAKPQYSIFYSRANKAKPPQLGLALLPSRCINFLKSKSSQKKYNQRKEQNCNQRKEQNCNYHQKVSKPKLPPRERPHSDTDADIEKLGKKLEGIVSRRKVANNNLLP